MLENVAREYHSSSMQKIAIYGLKKFYNIGPRSQSHKFGWRKEILANF
jgi:hypothetical protein